MKKLKSYLLLLIGLVFMSMTMTSCSTIDVQEGTKGVLVKRPYIFGSDGVETLEPGRHVIAWSSTVVPVDVKPDRKTEKFDDLNTKDNVPVDFDISFTLQNNPSEVGKLYSNFGLDYYVKTLEQELRNITRDKCKTYDMTPLTNDAKISLEINNYVKEEGNKIIKSLGIPVTLIAANMGLVNPPKAVIDERSNTAAAKQREQTINQETINQGKRLNSETARAKADRAYQDALGLSTNEYIQLQSLKVKEIGYNKASSVTIIEGDVSLTKPLK